MTATLVLMLANMVSYTETTHIRTTEPVIAALIKSGLATSPTFQRLAAALDTSNVIVYVEPKMTRGALGGYLDHRIHAAGGFRYLRIAIDIHGSERRLIPVLAHELQHAVEVAHDAGAVDLESVRQVFDALNISIGCGATCYETQAAIDVESRVCAELEARAAGMRNQSSHQGRQF
jgi:hypothetical protein